MFDDKKSSRAGLSDRPMSAAPKRLRALIVEDEILIAWHLQGLLAEMAIEANALTSSGRAALDLMRSEEFDVIFMDINLVGSMDGVETARRIRENSEVPIIFVTAYAGYDDISAALASIGSIAVLGKPALQKAVAAALRDVGLIN